MEKTLIVLCAAIAITLVGCDQNRGGASSSSNRDTGYGSSRSMNQDNSALSPSSSINSTNTNNAAVTPSPDTYGQGTPRQDNAPKN